ncbi:MAG TPA: CHASE3 domain-containing protein [Cytophagaceae bacterium]|jgi:signal transduction histidine kinase|nr:CHASE3 domain-containing protein [Cytophagaceae bacterium]
MMNIRFKFSKFAIFTFGLIFATVFLFISVFYSYDTSGKLYENFEWVDHTYKVKEKLESIELELIRNESALRGFAISGDTSFLGNFNANTGKIFGEIGYLRKLISDNHNQQARLLILESLVLKRIQLFKQSILILKRNKEKVELRLLMPIALEGKKYMNKIHELKTIMSGEENELLIKRQHNAKRGIEETNLTILISGLVSLSILIFVTFIIKKDISERVKLENSLRLLDQNKNKFFSIISHDLRGPIHGLSRLASFIDSDKTITKEEKSDMMEAIKNTTVEIGTLLENLLLWSKHQMGKIEIRREKFDIKRIVENSITLLKNSSLSKNISIINEVESQEVYADKNMIDTVTRNIIHNATKFTGQGGEIIIKSKMGRDNKLEIRVIDNGIGISPEGLKKIFQVQNVQASKGTDNERGSGLGLILCKDFIEINGGNINAESEEGKGTEIFFTIPTLI